MVPWTPLTTCHAYTVSHSVNQTSYGDIVKHVTYGNRSVMKNQQGYWLRRGCCLKEAFKWKAMSLTRVCRICISMYCWQWGKMSGGRFDEILSAIENVARLQENAEGIRVFEIPSLALRLGHNLLKCAELKRGMGIRQQNGQLKEEAETFIQLHSSEWTDKVSSIALATLKTNHFNKPEMLPVTEDLVLLKNFLVQTMEDENKQITKEPSYASWRALAEATLSRIILFNKRRGSEASNLLLLTYSTRPNWVASANTEIVNSLLPMERKLLDRLDMVQTQGKQNKRVPIILTPDMIASIDNLVKHREEVGIKTQNRYLFATAAEGHLDSWQVLQNVAKAAGCKQPNLISSTRLRKYIATVCQVSAVIIVFDAFICHKSITSRT